MNSETNMTQPNSFPEAIPDPGILGPGLPPIVAVIDAAAIKAIRHNLHELANVFTGVMIAGGLLSQHLEKGSLHYYASNICEGSERGCALVREIRSQLLAACGEVEHSRGQVGTAQR